MSKLIEEELIHLLDQYIPVNENINSGGQQLNQMYKTLQSPEILIPVLGLQGVGKSTLLNALLEENIMPNEAEETTCIPVEVRYSQNPKIIAHFLNGKKIEIKKEKVKEYVDNNYNPANEKLVSHIVIFRNLDILKKGIVLVDLPGVGSMTANNQRVTNEYIQRLYAAIFIVRVNPPITRTEATFIKFAWQSLCNTWFVQNKWKNESEREAKEGYEANVEILNDIAATSNMTFNNELLTVDAYSALVGVLQNKDEDYEKSNIDELKEKLNSIDHMWMDEMKFNFNQRALSMVQLAKRKIENILIEIELSDEELRSKLDYEEKQFEKNTEKVRKVVKEAIHTIEEEKFNGRRLIRELMQVAEENIRGNVFKVIDSGLTDGEDLNRVFQDYQNREFEMVNNRFIQYRQNLINKVTEKTSELEYIFQDEAKGNYNAYEFNKKQELKWEKGLEAGIKVGGGIGGILAATKVGAAVGTGIGGPVGTIIGSVAGAGTAITVSIFATITGGKSKSLVVAKRASKTKQHIRPIIDDLCGHMREELTEVFNNMSDQLILGLNQYYEDRVKYHNQLKEENLEIYKSTSKVIGNKEDLGSDFEYLSSQEVKFNDE